MHPSIWLAAVAGLVQGVVEWLPVSSKTIITLIFAAGGVSFTNAYVLGLLANFGSFFAALWYFRREIGLALRGLAHPFANSDDAVVLRYLFFATLATGVIGLPIYVAVRHVFGTTSATVAMLLIGLLLVVTSLISRRREQLAAKQPEASSMAAPGIVTTLIVGACQGLAALPGISRSAVTVTPLLLRGHSAKDALRLSFLLDVVALLGAAAVPLALAHGKLAALGHGNLEPTVVMILVAAVVSFFTIDAILRAAQRLRSSVLTLAIGILTILAAIVVH